MSLSKYDSAFFIGPLISTGFVIMSKFLFNICWVKGFNILSDILGLLKNE